MKDTENKQDNLELSKAVKIVKEAIRGKEDYYRRIAGADEQSPVMLEGRTHTGYDCQMMVDPKDVAKVFLEYQYPLWLVLEEEPSLDMWDRLAEIYGLDGVVGVDL